MAHCLRTWRWRSSEGEGESTMADCECLAKCPFFHDKMEGMPGMTGVYKRRYCEGSSRNCARHIVFREFGATMVPADLFPNEVERADRVLDEMRQTG